MSEALLTRYRDNALGVELFLLVDDYEQRFLEAYREIGFGDVQRSHGAVLRHLDGAGASISQLAERSGLTKQGIGKIVRQLEALGYLSIVTSQEDRRSRMVRFSLRGERLVSASNRVVSDIRRDYRSRLGAQAFDQLYDTLNKLTLALGVQSHMLATGDARRFLHFGRLLVELACDFETRLQTRLTPEQARLFSRPALNQFYYFRAPGMTVSELAAPQPLTVQAVSLSSRSMVRQGLLSVRESPRDSRAKELTLSEQGQAWLQAVTESAILVQAEYSAAIGKAALNALDRSLARLLLSM